MPRITEYLKSLTTPKTQTINQDGREYQFTPGEHGSLVTKGPKPTTFYNEEEMENKPKAKVIMPQTETVETGSTRG